MSAEIPTTEPTSLRAGDRAQWTKTLSDYPPADGWDLKYRLLNESVALDAITATEDGTTYSIDLPTTYTADLAAGIYQLTGWVEKSGDRKTIYLADVEILANLAAATSAVDSRSHVKKVLDALEAMIEGRATNAEESIVVPGFGNKQIQYLNPLELRKARNLYRREYEEELRATARKNGRKIGGRKTLVRFSSIT
jgi:hypothetical protein